ncbi:MAG: hypothetical protein B9S32_06595 [Verrucomicrobia bacterium Tous-C9LFEB]|nr:MAG: hypothetical protein B9S32_06595 [Verrucomicrobia bacterium Tous-C9LFEB]
MNSSPAALVLIGHGSTLNADSSAPTYQHAETIRQRDLFSEVVECFWKEEPNFRQTLRSVNAKRVYLVPNFISSGYFTEQVIPREFGLSGPITRMAEGRELFYCDPVGLHPVMTETLLHRAAEVVAKAGVPIENPRKSACLLICGHGTSLNDNSTKIIQQRVEEIRARGLYADCQMVLMEQKPFVKDWRSHTNCRDVIVVPYFISDGLHSFEDIPVLLGITENVRVQGVQNPHNENGRRLWYATAIGTEPMMADVVLAQVEKFNADHAITTTAESSPASIIGFPLRRVGQVVISENHELRHRNDVAVEASSLRVIADWVAWRELLRTNAQGEFRPLKAAPNLPRGWRFPLASEANVALALQFLYPAALANWHLWEQGKLPVIPYLETADRQTGRYRIVRALPAAALEELTTTVCARSCLKQRLWGPNPARITAATGELPLLCPEACNYFIEKAREKIKGPQTAEE